MDCINLMRMFNHLNNTEKITTRSQVNFLSPTGFASQGQAKVIKDIIKLC